MLINNLVSGEPIKNVKQASHRYQACNSGKKKEPFGARVIQKTIFKKFPRIEIKKMLLMNKPVY